MFVAVVNCGVTPTPQTMGGETGPELMMDVAPDDATPVDQKLAVPDPAVPVGKLIVDAGLITFPVSTHPEVDRTIATRAYPVYAISLVDWLPD